MQKIKVAFFADVLIRGFDGANRTMFQLIDRIDSNRFEFLFICGDTDFSVAPNEVIVTPSISLPINNTYRMATPIFSNRRLKQRLDDYKPNVIHISTPSPIGFLALKYAEKHGIPVLSIYHTHFMSYVKYYTHNLAIITGMVERMIVRSSRSFYSRCHKVLIPSKAIMMELKARNFDVGQCVHWARGVDLSVFCVSEVRPNYLNIQQENGRLKLLFVSRLVWEKNLKTLIGIYSVIEKYNLPYDLIIAGDGVAMNVMVKEMPKAQFLGELDHHGLASIYQSCDYFLFPSITETFGNVLLEAMACGLPCIAANGGSNPSLIQHGINGFLAIPDSPQDYLRKISLLEESPFLKEIIKKNADQFARSHDWSLLADEYFDIISELSSSAPIKRSKNLKYRNRAIQYAFK